MVIVLFYPVIKGDVCVVVATGLSVYRYLIGIQRVY